ncbi:DNA gyrase inhibitor YacG [Salinicola corii]|uniref:DNA gyrase inhibitor YacG n=1 Tax=Salinicola corii TaxID=2606937 RepID=A0A640WJS3_9GAMM|nr:DNA gyrase inhibitor YacG [Salinicola corii]KAA0020899.1 DNA gyrase inhibitor YacG [Salinicola corii]
MTRSNDPSNANGAGKGLTVPCPQCQQPVAWTTENAYRPFCSKRCKLIDLGAWADGSHRIPGEPHMDETELDELIDRLERGE